MTKEQMKRDAIRLGYRTAISESLAQAKLAIQRIKHESARLYIEDANDLLSELLKMDKEDEDAEKEKAKH